MKSKIIWKIFFENLDNGSRSLVYVDEEKLEDAFELIRKGYVEPNLSLLWFEKIHLLTEK